MQDRDLFQQLLGIGAPWRVGDIELRFTAGEVIVHLEHVDDAVFHCPECGAESPIHDHAEERSWRHLDTMQFRTIVRAAIPRTRCRDHGVLQVRVSWSEPKSRFTLLYERLAIDWIRSAGSQKAVATRLGLSWDEVHGIMERAVRRGLGRRRAEPVKYLGIDEKSYRRRHRYVTFVSSLGAEGEQPRVLYVAEGRKESSLDGFWATLTPEQRQSIEAVAMDMWDPYENSVRAHLEGADEKIVYDEFHVIAHLSRALDEVRREENARLRKSGDNRLKGTRYGWLTNPANMSSAVRDQFFAMKKSGMRTAKVWTMRFVATSIWSYRYAALAKSAFLRWYTWAIRSRLKPVMRVAKMMKSQLPNILPYAKHSMTNATSESMNSKIQWVKYTARGFRNIDNFTTAIYFHCGGLDLSP